MQYFVGRLPPIGRDRAFVLRIEPRFASRPFGLQSHAAFAPAALRTPFALRASLAD